MTQPYNHIQKRNNITVKDSCQKVSQHKALQIPIYNMILNFILWTQLFLSIIQRTMFENTVRKEENVHKQQYLSFFAKHWNVKRNTRKCTDHPERQNSRPVQFESVCRQHFTCSSNDDLCY